MSNKCRYVYLIGKKKGQKCLRSCRGTMCKEHNSKRKVYEKKYVTDVRTTKTINSADTREDKVNQCKDLAFLQKLLIKSQLELFKVEDVAQGLLREIRGIRLFLGEITVEDMFLPFKKALVKKGKYSNDDIINNTIPDSELPGVWKLFKEFEVPKKKLIVSVDDEELGKKIVEEDDDDEIEKQYKKKAKKRLRYLLDIERSDVLDEINKSKQFITVIEDRIDTLEVLEKASKKQNVKELED